MYLNKVYLIGNLTQDPELKSLPNGSSVASFSLATNRTWSDKQGQKQEATEYHNIVSYGKQAEIISQYLKKGSLMMIEGRLQTRSWDAQDGQKKYRTEVILENFQMGPKGQSTGQTKNMASKATPNPSPAAREDLPTVNLDEEEIDLEEIPF